MADPEPDVVITVLDSDGSIMVADSGRPKPTNSLEVKRWVAWIGFEEVEIVISEQLDFWRAVGCSVART